MTIEIALEALKTTLAQAREDEAKSKAAHTDAYGRGIDAGLVIGLDLAVKAIERGLAK